MKVIVNNEAEKDLFERLFLALTEDYLIVIEEDDTKSEKSYLESGEYSFAHEGLHYVKIEVDDSIEEIYFDDEVVTGKCVECGLQTEGMENRCFVTYQEYLNLISEESQNNWLCSECYEERIRKEEGEEDE